MNSSKPADSTNADIGDWPTGRNKIETAAHVHAFGIIAMSSSMLEELLLLLLLGYLPINRDTARRLAGGLNNRERGDWLSALVAKNETWPELADHLRHAILCCNICLDNRNMLIHSLYSGTDEVTTNMRLSKRARRDPLRELKFEVSVTDLRKIADEIGNTVNYIIDLWFVKNHLNAQAPPIAWPEKLQRPDRLLRRRRMCDCDV
jgi:hypothetical protein